MSKIIYRYYVENTPIERQFNSYDEVKMFVAENHSIQTFQVQIVNDDVRITNKLGEVFAYVGRILNK